MFHKIKSIKAVWNYFQSIKDNIYFINESRIVVLNSLDGSKELIFQGEFQSLFRFNDEIWAFDASQMNTIVVNGVNIIKLPFATVMSNDGLLEQHSFTTMIKKEDIFLFAKIDLKNKTVEDRYILDFNKIGLWKILKNDTFLSRKDSLITCHPLSTGEEKWRIDIGDIGKYLRLGEMTQGSVHSMDAYENVLCVALGNDVILGIDIETGKTIWQRQMTLMTGLPYTFSEGKLYCFSLEKIGGIISNEGVNYHVFDMQTGAEEVHVFPTPFDTPLGFTKPTIAGNLLLTTDVYARKIYLMDKQTAVVQETITLEGEGSRIPIDNSPQLHGNRLYQLDGDRVLHIFEDEMV